MLLTPQFFEGLSADLRNNRIDLPPMPDVAAKVNRCAGDPNVGAAELARVISTDPTLAGRLLQVANSPYFRSLKPVESVQAAVARLGTVCVRNLVSSLVMGRLFNEIASPAIRRPLRAAWEHATRVAAHSFVVARLSTQLNAEEAMLAGLVHNAGLLPILLRASKDSMLMARFALLLEDADANHTTIGAQLVEQWAFPESIVAAVLEHENLTRLQSGPADLADVVCVANLHCRLGTQHRLGRVDWSAVPAFQRLGLTPEFSIRAIREARAQLDALQGMLRQ